MKIPRYKRSRFLFTYWNEDDRIVLYNYNRQTKAVVSKDMIKLLDVLSDWKSVQQLSDLLEIDKKHLMKALKHLVELKMIHKDTLKDEGDLIDVKVPWDPIDLALQRQRSYGGRHPMTNRKGKSPSPIKLVKGLSTLALSPPSNLHQNEDDLLGILGKRRSVRRYGNDHISLEKLSAFLYHTARIKKIFRSEEGTLTKRPYPSGGARYPLEIYVLNNRINGFQRGIHYYDPLKHQLVLLNKNKNHQKKFNSFVKAVLHPTMTREPDVTLIITAVFARTMWKYDRLGISLILSDLGCLYQTMYLVATEMKLGPCPVGKIEEELVKEWLNLNWFEESHVGTFMLGIPDSSTINERKSKEVL